MAMTAFALDTKDWFTGRVFLKTNEVLEGKIRFTQKLDLIECKTEGKVLTYSPYQVKVFQYFDEATGTNKTFTSITDFSRGELGQKKFFEVVLTGKISIFRNGRNIVKQVYPKFDAHAGKGAFKRTSTYVEVTQYDYYVYVGDRLLKWKDFEKQWLKHCQDAKDQINEFIAAHELQLKNNLYDQLKVLEYYNTLHHEVNLSLYQELSLYER